VPCANHALFPFSCIINFIIQNARMKDLSGVQVKLVEYHMGWNGVEKGLDT
jgi:hypothetical protein